MMKTTMNGMSSMSSISSMNGMNGMTSTMLAGAVAINGGVGVMELRRPIVAAQTAKNATDRVADVADKVAGVADKVAGVADKVAGVADKVADVASNITSDFAANAHITLRELKAKIGNVAEQKLPTFKQLMEQNPTAVAQAKVNNATLTAYENGYAVYETEGTHTVMAVERCGDYRYDFNDGTHEVVSAEVFEDAEWSLRLVMEGERRMEHNLNKTSSLHEVAPLECDGSDWSDAVMVDFLQEDNIELLADKEIRKLYAAMTKLTARQNEIIQLYFYKGMTQQEIAEELGIARPVVTKSIKAALKCLRKNF